MAQEANSWDPGSIAGCDTSLNVPETSCFLSGPWLHLESRSRSCLKILDSISETFGNSSYPTLFSRYGKRVLLTVSRLNLPISKQPCIGSTMYSECSDIRISKVLNFIATWLRSVVQMFLAIERCYRRHAHHQSFILRSLPKDWVVCSSVIACFAVEQPAVVMSSLSSL